MNPPLKKETKEGAEEDSSAKSEECLLDNYGAQRSDPTIHLTS